MVSVSIRAVLMPGVALAAVGAVALAPTLVAPTAAPVQPHVAVPAVYIADIQLAGIGRDIYNSASAVVQGLAQWAQWAVGIIPFLGSGIAAQINLIYAELIQPLIGNTVYALSDIIANPLGLLTTAGSYISNQVYVGYTFVASEIRFFGLPPILGPLPKPPPLASVGGSRARPVAARNAGPRAAAVAPASAEAPADLTAAVPSPVGAGRGELRRAARTAVAGAPKAARGAAARPARPAAARSHSPAKAVASTASFRRATIR
jgi:hypothetical protein